MIYTAEKSALRIDGIIVGHKIDKKEPNHRSDVLVTNDDGIRFFRGLIYGAILAVSLWAIIGLLYGGYASVQRFI